MFALNENVHRSLLVSLNMSYSEYWRYRYVGLEYCCVVIMYMSRRVYLVMIVFVGSIISFFYGLTGSFFLQISQKIGMISGFTINKIQISPMQHISKNTIIDVLGIDDKPSMIGFDLTAARATLEALPWILSASIRKNYPDQLKITVVERQAVAVWQRGSQMDLIDRDGRVIVPYDPHLGKGLPLLVGRDAASHAAALLDQLKAFADISRLVRAYVRIGGRRWDIILATGIRIKLPERDAFLRLRDIFALDKQQGLFSKNLAVIDLRLADRIVFVPLEETVADKASQDTKMQDAGLSRVTEKMGAI